jgi:hypothetical protein
MGQLSGTQKVVPFLISFFVTLSAEIIYKNRLMMNQEKRKRWLRMLVWVVYPLTVAVVVGTCSSCGTKKELHQHTTHVVEADTMATEAKHDGHVSQTVQDLDSIVTASVWAAMQEFVKSEQEHEVTTETLTETIDSLGRVVRQQQKTTDRTLSRQELQRQQEQLQQLSTQLHRRLSAMDSAVSDRMSRFESHLRDSLNHELSKQTETSGAPAITWWQRLWQWLKGILAGVAICGAIYLTRRFWQPLIKR